MAYALNNVTPPNAFDFSSGVLRCPNSKSISVQVYNQGVYYQLALGRQGVSSNLGSENWEPSGDGAFLGPGLWNFDDSDFYGGVCHAIRFRVAVPGLTTPAQVSASA